MLIPDRRANFAIVGGRRSRLSIQIIYDTRGQSRVSFQILDDFSGEFPELLFCLKWRAATNGSPWKTGPNDIFPKRRILDNALEDDASLPDSGCPLPWTRICCEPYGSSPTQRQILHCALRSDDCEPTTLDSPMKKHELSAFLSIAREVTNYEELNSEIGSPRRSR